MLLILEKTSIKSMFDFKHETNMKINHVYKLMYYTKKILPLRKVLAFKKHIAKIIEPILPIHYLIFFN